MAYRDIEDQRRCCREHYARNKEKYAERNRRTRKAWKAELAKYKEDLGCQDCGGKFPAYVLDFDHRDPSLKRAEVSVVFLRFGRNAGWDEVAKCDVVCANCHRIRTHSGVV